MRARKVAFSSTGRGTRLARETNTEPARAHPQCLAFIYNNNSCVCVMKKLVLMSALARLCSRAGDCTSSARAVSINNSVRRAETGPSAMELQEGSESDHECRKQRHFYGQQPE